MYQVKTRVEFFMALKAELDRMGVDVQYIYNCNSRDGPNRSSTVQAMLSNPSFEHPESIHDQGYPLKAVKEAESIAEREVLRSAQRIRDIFVEAGGKLKPVDREGLDNETAGKAED